MSMFHKFFGRENSSLGTKKTRNSLINLSIEPLEERQMLAITNLVGGVISSVSAGEVAQLALTIGSTQDKATAAIGITVNATNDGGKLDPAAIRLVDAEGKAISASSYLYDFNGKDSSTVIVNLPSGNYQIQISGENGSYGSFTCDVFMPGVASSEDGTGAVTPLDALRAQTAAAQGSGNFNEQTINYYNSIATSLGYSKTQFNAAQPQYRDYFDFNDDGIISAAEATWVNTNSKAGTVTVSLNAAAEITISAGVTHWLISDTAATKTKTAVLDITGSVSSNVVKLEAMFEGAGAFPEWEDITSHLGSTVGGVKSFQLDAEALEYIYFNEAGMPPGTYTIKFRAYSGDAKQAPALFSYTFTLVAHTQPVSKAPAAQTLYPVSTDSSVEWSVAELVENPGTTFSYWVHTIFAYDEEYELKLNSAGDGYNAIEVKNGSTIMGTLTYTGGTKGADGHFYGGKLVFKPTAAQVALSKGADDIAVNFTFIVQDDSAVSGKNRTGSDKSIAVTIRPVNKTPVVTLTGAKTTFDPNDAAYTYKLSGTGNGTSAVIASDANTADLLSFKDSVVVSVNGTTLTATGSASENKVWTTAQGTVITLVWDAASSSYTELKITPTTSTTAVAESISIKFIVKDNAGVTTAGNGDQVSETAEQTLAITVNGITAKPVVTGNDLTITAAQAAAGNIVTGWQATGTGITKYEIGKAGTTLVTITLGGTATVAGVGTFKLESDGKLTWVTVDPTFIPTAGAENKTADLTFQATNPDGTTTLTKKLTVTAASTVEFGPQTLYVPTNGVVVDGKIASGGVLTWTAPTGTNVAFTVESVQGPSGSTAAASDFEVTSNGRIRATSTLPAGEYKLQVKANFTGAVTDSKTAEITVRIEAGAEAGFTVSTSSVNENAAAPVEVNIAVTGLPTGVDWAIVNGSLALNATVQVTAHNDVAAYTKTLTAAEITKLLSEMTIVRDGSGIKATFTPGTEFNTMFQFLSETQKATLVYTFEIRDDRYGLVSEGTITLTVNGKNDQPVRQQAAYTANTTAVPVDLTEGVKIEVDSLLGLFTDPDLADKHFLVVNDVDLKVDGNTVTLESGATLTYKAGVGEEKDYLLYIPNGDYEDYYSAQHGAALTDTFNVYVKDDSGQTNAKSVAAVTVTVNLKGVNKTPAFKDTSVITKTVTEKDTTTFTINIEDIATDANIGDDLTFGTIVFIDSDGEEHEYIAKDIPVAGVKTPTGSTILVSADGKELTIIPSTDVINLRQGQERIETYKFSVKDDQNLANSESAKSKELKVTITGVNDAPVASKVTQDVEESDAFDAWASWISDVEGYNHNKWVKINWQDKIYDPDQGETNLLTLTINGYNLVLGEEFAFPEGTFILRQEAGELVLRFRPKENYFSLKDGEDVTLSFTIQATDPLGLKSAVVDLEITILGETTTMSVGNGIQTFYVSTVDPLKAFREVRYFSDLDEADIDLDLLVIDAAKTTGGTFQGFAKEADGKIEITPDAALTADFADLDDGDIIVYKVYFTYDGEEAGYVFVSIIKGGAPVDVDPVDYTLTVSEKHLTDKDRPYTPALPAGYTVGKITPLLPADFLTENPETAYLQVLEDAIDELEEGVHYGINEDGRFWFDPKEVFHFLRQDQIAKIVFNVPLFNAYGYEDSGTITVVVTGVNDRPAAVNKNAGEVWANDTTGIKVLVSDLVNDKDVDDTHSIIVYQNGEVLGTLAQNGNSVTLASGATLTYVTDPDGDYLLYKPNGTASGPFYSLQSKATLPETITFRAKDNSNMGNSESENTATLTFTVKGVNKTPVVNTDLTRTVDADKTITINASDLATDANIGDVLSFVSIQYGSDTWTAAGTHEIRGEFNGNANALLGTLVIAANMQSFTFTPNAALLADEETGLDPGELLDLEFVFVIKDNAGILTGDANEQPSEAAPATLKLQIQGISHGPALKGDPDVNISLKATTGPLEAGGTTGLFSGTGVYYTKVELVNPLASDSFVKSVSLVDGKLVVEHLTRDEYAAELDLSPVQVKVNVSDAEGNTLDEDVVIYLNCVERETITMYVVPSNTPLTANSQFNQQNWNAVYAGKDEGTPFVPVGETYYLQIFIQDDTDKLLKMTPEEVRKFTTGLFSATFRLSYNPNAVTIDLDDEDFNYVSGAAGVLAEWYHGAQAGWIDVESSIPYEQATMGWGVTPRGWVAFQIPVTVKSNESPNFEVHRADTVLGTIVRSDEGDKDVNVHNTQIKVVNPIINHPGPALTALTQQEKEVDGGIYMRTVTTPTETRADGTVASLPQDANWLHEWQSHYVELWVKASEVDQYISAKTDLHYNTRYFTAVSVELGQDFRFGAGAVIDDPSGLVSGIGGASAGSVSKDGYILLGRVLFQSIGTDNVPWSEAMVPHSLGLELSNGGVRMSDGYWISQLGSGSKTELWANPFDANDDGTMTMSDFAKFALAYKASKTADVYFSPFDVTRTGGVTMRDFASFAINYKVTREGVVSGQQKLNLPESYTQRYVGSTLQVENQAIVGAMLDAANQAWADALGLAKPIDVTLVVKDFGDSTTLGEAQITAIGANGLPTAGIITLDNDAAGFGWYSQIVEPVNASKYDLYTTLLHELGHLYGINEAYAAYNAVKPQFAGQLDSGGHVLDPNDVMFSGLYTGERKYISDLDVLLLQTVYGQARGNSALHAFTNTPMKIEALGARPVTEVAELTIAPAAAAPAVALSVETVVTVLTADDVFEEAAKLTVAVAKESALPVVLDTRENAKTLAELNTLGLDVSLPQVTPNYSAALNADLILGEQWSDDDLDFLTVPVVQQAEKCDLLDQLIADLV